MKESPYVEVKDSAIHNKGMFAIKDIPKDTEIIEYVGRKMSKEESDAHADAREEDTIYIFEVTDEYDLDGDVDYNPAKYINHSCEPNCEAINIDDRIWICATRDIKKGEELLYNYGFSIDNYKDHPCHCGTKNCVGYIVDRDQWPKLKKKLEHAKKKEKRKKSAAKKKSN